jgi:PIN domain nuclease of toxin-antitoxin system
VTAVRLLPDPDALLWWVANHPALSGEADRLLSDPAHEVYVSAASAWEVATKVRLGKLPGAEFLAQHFSNEMERQGFIPLPVMLEHGRRAGALPGSHKDPFDRMLIAQAQAENLRLVSSPTKPSSTGTAWCACGEAAQPMRRSSFTLPGIPASLTVTLKSEN